MGVVVCAERRVVAHVNDDALMDGNSSLRPHPQIAQRCPALWFLIMRRNHAKLSDIVYQ